MLMIQSAILSDLSPILVILFTILLIVLLFLFFRGVSLWYFKIERRLEEQQKTNQLLSKILEKLNESKS